MNTLYKKSFLYALVTLCGVVLIAGAVAAFAQTDLPVDSARLPEGVSQSQFDAAMQDLSAVYGSPVVRIDQAKAICNDEQYFLECAEIGKKHDLFDAEREKQVDTLVEELKGDVFDKLAQCTDVDCLVGVATSLAQQLSKSSPAVARAVDLTSQKVDEKRAILATAKEIGVDFEQCRTMDPDTASIDLLRACARLAKDERIQKYIPEQTRENSGKSDASIALKEGLASGEFQCGDGTLEGCGNFCLNPSAEARAQGTAAIPPICRQIAERFFGLEGVAQLEESHSVVQRTFDSYANREGPVFTTPNGQTLTNPLAIGRYMEEAGQRGDVVAIQKGMDFMVANGFASSADRDFAVKMVQKIQERGAINFDDCRTNPEACRDFVPEEHQGGFAAMGQVEKIMRTAMANLGVTDPSRCEFDHSIGQACMDGARAALPQIRVLAGQYPELNAMIADLEQKIRFGQEAFAARGRAKERIQTGGVFTVGDQQFRSMADLEVFCRTNSQQCLAEAARSGVFAREVAAEKYQYAAEQQHEQYNPDERFAPLYQPLPRQEVGIAPNQPQQYPTFDKEAARKAFEAWLDNPQGPPPMPTVGPYQPYQPYPYPAPEDIGSVYPYPYPNTCLMVSPKPCPAGEYRQESRNAQGCFVYGSCIPISTKTLPKPIDGKTICPAMPTVNSCAAGEERFISYSSPECGTYYSCKSVGTDIQPTPIGSTDCSRYGSGWHTMDSGGNCFNTAMSEYRTPGGTLQQCSSAPVYGCSNSNMTTPSCSSDQYWNGTSCVSNTTTGGGMQRCFYPNASKNSQYVGYTVWCEKDYYNCHEGSPSGATVSLTGLSLGAPSTCESGWTGNTSSCPSGQYWDGTKCGTGQDGCTKAGGSWDTATNYCKMPTGSTPCSSGQYWNGSACVNTSTTDCPSGQYWSGSACVSGSTATTTSTYPTTSSQGKNQTWNSYGLQSWIREDADPARISSLKQACASVKSSSANIWMPNAGTYSSSDFGMPDPAKCASWAPPQCSDNKDNDGDGWIDYPNDSGCTSPEDNNEVYEAPPPTTTTTTNTYAGDANSCPGFAYSRWDSTGRRYCQLNNEARCDYGYPSYLTNGTNYSMGQCPGGTTSSTNTSVSGTCSDTLMGLLGTGCHSMGNAWFNSGMTQYVMPSTTEVKNCSTSWVSGCTGGTTTTTTTSSSPTCSSYANQSSCVGNSACNWNTVSNYCTYNSTSGGDYGSCSTAASQSSCTSISNCYWYSDSTSNYCYYSSSGGSSYSGSGSTCTSGQYWNGSSCVTSTYSSDPQTACIQGGGTWNSSTSYCQMPGSTACSPGQYWNGSSCVSNTTTTDYSSAQSSCTSAGGTWNSSSNYCQMPSSSPSSSCGSGQYWDGSACVTSPTSYFCPTGHDWNGSHCIFAQNATQEKFTASVLWAFLALFDF